MINIEPTPEMWDAPINGVKVPTRIWKGKTAAGVEIEAYVLSIVPTGGERDAHALRDELPDFMVPSRQMFKIDIPH